MSQLQRHTRPQHPLWQLTLMRWRIFVREPSAVFWTYGFPVVLALALGVAFRNRPPEPVEVAVEATDGCEGWRDALATNSQLHVRWLNPQEAREALRVGKVSVVVGRQGSSTPEPSSSRGEANPSPQQPRDEANDRDRIGAPNSALGASPKATPDQL